MPEIDVVVSVSVSLPEVSVSVAVLVPEVKPAVTEMLSLPEPPRTVIGNAVAIPEMFAVRPSLLPPVSASKSDGVTEHDTRVVFSPEHEASAAIVMVSKSLRLKLPGPAVMLTLFTPAVPV
jgi:hypothetical protein